MKTKLVFRPTKIAQSDKKNVISHQTYFLCNLVYKLLGLRTRTISYRSNPIAKTEQNMKLSVHLPLLLLLVWAQSTKAQDEDAYRYRVNLIEVINDMVGVELLVPANILEDEMTFHFPKIIPGTYEIHDFGRFVQGLKAFDTKNAEMEVERVDQNTWVIKKAKKLAKITYLVEDTWDAKLREPVFEPAGSNIEAGKNFVLNGNTCFGFFKGKDKLPFRISFDRPANFYGTTSMRRIGGDFDTDIFKVGSYHELVDAPVMYCEPDTVNFKLGYGDIQISVYSPNKVTKAKELAKGIRPVLEAQIQYLGNILPVDRYSFILYLSPEGYPSGSVGALEHARSSFFCLTEEESDKISKLVIDIASHEFFHMVTPLHIHSEQIHNFDFMDPKMSKHLWLYEGVIEYMAQHMQAKHNLLEDESFLETIGEKVRSSMRYKDGYSLVEISSNCLVEPYSKQYNNIYYKGALVAMCLDLKLLALTNGKYDIQLLLRDLSMYYGQDKPFKDSELFDQIVKITKQPALKEFFAKYIEGIEKLPYNEFLEPFGVEYLETAKIKEISPLGGIENGAFKTDTLDRFYISRIDRLDEFGTKYIGFKADDIILEWNGKPLSIKNISAVFISYMNNVKPNDNLEIKILRKNEKGELKEQILKTPVVKIDVDQKHVFRFKENPTAQQLALRKAWLEPRIGQ